MSAEVCSDWETLLRAARRGRRGRAGTVGGLWLALDGTTESAPTLRATVEALAVPVRWGDSYVVVGDPQQRKHLRLEPWEWALAQRMDGTRTVDDLVALHLEATGRLDPDAVRGLVDLLRLSGLLEGAYVDVWASLAEAVAPVPTRRQRLLAGLSTLSVEWSGAERTVQALYRAVLQPLFVRWLQPVLVLIAVAGVVAFGVLAADGRLTLSEGSVVGGVALIGLSLVMTFVHELGHATYLVHRQRRVYSAGFMLYFGSPAFFVDSTDGLLLERRDRIKQAFAGPYFELVAGGAVALLALFVDAGPVADVLHVFVLLLYFGVFMNLIPLLELDGYFIFAELLQTPSLRADSFQFVRHELPHRVLKRRRLRPHEIWFTLYVLVGTAFTAWSLWMAAIFWWALFGPMVSGLWSQGPLGRVLLVVAVAALAGPAVQGLVKLGRTVAHRSRRLIDGLVFRAQSRWRIEAALLLDDSPVFGDLPVEILNDLAGRITRRRIDAGQVVFRQGDRADAFYVVRSGTLQVEADTPDGLAVLTTLERGDTFGELGLLGHEVRQATVRASRDTELFVVDENDFDRLLRDATAATGAETTTSVAPTLAALAPLAALGPFTHLTSAQLAALHQAGSWVEVAPGQTVVREGGAGDAFYAIGSGRLEVTKGRRRLQTLEPGDAFGEIALRERTTRTATVRAVTPARLFVLPPAAFRRFVDRSTRTRTYPEPARRIMSH